MFLYLDEVYFNVDVPVQQGLTGKALGPDDHSHHWGIELEVECGMSIVRMTTYVIGNASQI